jgi:glycosyltransferase involved in cell wall biosynthesis
LHALVVSNMLPDARHPERGSFVRDQVAALRRLGDVELELFEFAPGGRALAEAAVTLRRRYRGTRFDVVHAHFGLTAWPALAAPAWVRALTVHGTDVAHPRTRLATAAALGWTDLPAAVSEPLVQQLPWLAARRRARVLPCGVDLERFLPLPRERCRSELQLDPERAYLLFAADPARTEKRHDRALALARACGVELLSLGGVAPAQVPLYVNAANAVVVPSDREGFGLAVLEALACDVPVLATPVGIHPEALRDVEGTLCGPFELERWRAFAAPLLAADDPRVSGRASATRFSAQTMAKRVKQAWEEALARSGDASG